MITRSDLDAIRVNCQQFIQESNCIPLVKNLPARYPSIKRVKVRHKSLVHFGELFNEAIGDRAYNKCVFANGPFSFAPVLDSATVALYDIYYIFPPDNFKYLYNPSVPNIGQCVESLSQINDDELVKQAIRLGFKSTELHEGLAGPSQVMVYNIPYFYAIKASEIDYNTLIQLVS